MLQKILKFFTKSKEPQTPVAVIQPIKSEPQQNEPVIKKLKREAQLRKDSLTGEIA